MTMQQRIVCNFGRKMMDLAALETNDTIANALARVGERLAETASIDGLTDVDHKIIRYAHQKIS